MMWVKLIDFERRSLRRGSLIKFHAGYPFEDEVVMMVCSSPEGSLNPALITITGHKAGINCYVAFPSEAQCEGVFLDVKWLIDNWAKWVWPEGSAEDVWASGPMSVDSIVLGPSSQAPTN
ncbi:immunity protein 45 of polymorphic toxin system [Comamonas sp. BIGb0124]|uniref:Imm45 family immunity protein n=1 Tax=Comamonas sp. BIGb0124 TaxID=2485130 RepID=UPI000F479FB7|nr:immunity protein 45 of polymorphic toxin system [Comamonas sp. BIGb0124]